MRIVLAPNAFKGTLTAVEAAEAMAEGIRRVLPEADLVLVPIADGGDGTVEALVAATGGGGRSLLVRGPPHSPVPAGYRPPEGGGGGGVQVACDVTNPLTGPHGASAVYGPQKGATPQMVAELDAALRRLAAVIRRDLGREVETLPGAGAAGGLGAGLVAFTGAQLRPGADMVMDAVRLDDRLRGADLVLTGEGRLDAQTARFGKGPAAVAKRARAAGIPVIAIAGGVTDHAEVLEIFDGLEETVSSSTPLEEAMAQAGPLLTDAAERALRRRAKPPA